MLHISLLLASFQLQRSVNPIGRLADCSSCNVLGNCSGTFTLSDLMVILFYQDDGRGV